MVLVLLMIIIIIMVLVIIIITIMVLVTMIILVSSIHVSVSGLMVLVTDSPPVAHPPVQWPEKFCSENCLGPTLGRGIDIGAKSVDTNQIARIHFK